MTSGCWIAGCASILHGPNDNPVDHDAKPAVIRTAQMLGRQPRCADYAQLVKAIPEKARRYPCGCDSYTGIGRIVTRYALYWLPVQNH